MIRADKKILQRLRIGEEKLTKGNDGKMRPAILVELTNRMVYDSAAKKYTDEIDHQEAVVVFPAFFHQKLEIRLPKDTVLSYKFDEWNNRLEQGEEIFVSFDNLSVGVQAGKEIWIVSTADNIKEIRKERLLGEK